jgi:hypothetical protein
MAHGDRWREPRLGLAADDHAGMLARVRDMEALWPWILLVLGLTGAACWWWNPPPFDAAMLIRVRSGQLHLARGSLQSHAREHVADILREAGISRGFIAVTSANRVVFSRTIPGHLHQRLRNVLLNQGA